VGGIGGFFEFWDEDDKGTRFARAVLFSYHKFCFSSLNYIKFVLSLSTF
jgi:hypothetical protein